MQNIKLTFIGTARRIQGDLGTENLNIAAIQMFFRKDHQDLLSGEKSFLFGKSTSNQVRQRKTQCFLIANLSKSF